ncbi:toxin VasX [Photobacterium galatheae]|uniref:Toxin VasX N-terminal region domain-containing protein n=1 Tax=Photobacterium galatheae TaxID=1654360 RepID=A0A066RW27_9GAMM|nr:toxin VasX [Photobacterium galatheae]KDM93296.1 hypothetical protein EA58_01415 [Photobacterium galatheae]MCM0150421.1 hypothetical protein [Photobacterium galatheae]
MADDNFPYPPEHSMYWEDNQFTYEQAKALYEQGEVPFSHSHDLNANGGEALTQPPKNSMMWEDEKVEHTVFEQRAPLKKRKKRQKKPVFRCHLFPVRYALDENDDAGQPKHGLPEGWRGKGFFFGQSIEPYAYTLRQLRDGWLYVYNETDKKLDEYELSGVTLTPYALEDYDFPLLSPKDGPTERGKPGASQPFLTCNSDASLRIVWSKQRWSWPMFYQFATDPSLRFNARHLQISRLVTHSSPHIADIEMLDQVADIDYKGGGEIERFSGLVHTKMPAVDDKEKEVLEVKPIASAAEIINAIPENETGYFVAINDPLSDLNEMGVRFSVATAIWHDFLEDQGIKNQMMESALQMTATGIPEGLNIRYPVLIDDMPKDEQLEIYQEICKLYELRKNYEDTLRVGTEKSENLARQLAIDLWKSEECFREKHGSISYSKYYADWEKLSKNRRMIHVDKLIKDKCKYLQEEDILINLVETHRNTAIAMAKAFGKYPIKGYADIYSQEGQRYLLGVHRELYIPLVHSRLTESQVEWLANEFKKPTTIFPLFVSAFSSDIYDIYALYDESCGDLELAANTDLLKEGSGATPVKDFVISYAAVLAFITDPGTQEHPKFKNFAKPLAKAYESFAEVISEPLKLGATKSVSAIAHSLGATLGVIGGTKGARYLIRAGVFGETLATSSETHVKEEYTKQEKAWTKKRQELESNINKNKRFYENQILNENESWSKIVKRGMGLNYDAETEAMYDAKQKANKYSSELDEHIKNKPSKMRVFASHISEEATNYVKKNLLDATKNSGKLIASSGVDLLVIFVTLKDYVEYSDGLKTNNVDTLEESLGSLQRLSYSVNSLAALFQAKAWTNFDVNNLSRQFTYNQLKSAGRIIGNRAQAGLRFARLTIIAATAGVIATSVESILTIEAFLKSENEVKTLNGIKVGLLSVQTLIGLIQIFGLSQGAVASVFNPWILCIFAFTNTAIMIVNALIDFFDRNEYQKWLATSEWGIDANIKWTKTLDLTELQNLYIEAILKLKKMHLKPIVYAQPDYDVVYNYSNTYPVAAPTQIMKGVTINMVLPIEKSRKILKLMISEPDKDETRTIMTNNLGLWLSENGKKFLEIEPQDLDKPVFQFYIPLSNKHRDVSFSIQYSDPNKSNDKEDFIYHYSFMVRDKNLTPSLLSEDEIIEKYKNNFSFLPQANVLIEG